MMSFNEERDYHQREIKRLKEKFMGHHHSYGFDMVIDWHEEQIKRLKEKILTNGSKIYEFYLWCKKCDKERPFRYHKATNNVQKKGNRTLIVKCQFCGSLWELSITNATKFKYGGGKIQQ